jgi:hypothetical protein
MNIVIFLTGVAVGIFLVSILGAARKNAEPREPLDLPNELKTPIDMKAFYRQWEDR